MEAALSRISGRGLHITIELILIAADVRNGTWDVLHAKHSWSLIDCKVKHSYILTFKHRFRKEHKTLYLHVSTINPWTEN